jgi:hypothetical protein
MRFLLVLATLASLTACSRADVDEGATTAPTPLGAAERIDRIQYLSNCSTAVMRAEDAYRHDKPTAEDIGEAVRLIQLAYQSASNGKAPVEAAWERQVHDALDQISRGIASKNASQVNDGLEKVKLYIDQAQQAASIEY